ncbi:unnamed protein product [Cuscuta epithymum]|uniref:Uncharacterized protein n=1 Tax=Cuscuta epithymum TaxID=186058 RepID=A0AAV0EAJ3_9ASTE|nr:unnamed protein product [Cuscuta epithymum]CAH9129624.1 unnamed protein product [Cuscuta epithymum]
MLSLFRQITPPKPYLYRRCPRSLTVYLVNGKDDEQSRTGEMQGTGSSNGSLVGRIQQQYNKIKENAETYPYVWGSYIAVYGGFGLWLVYRGMKLRRKEDRVRALQEQLRKLVESQESESSSVAGSSMIHPPKDKNTG